MGMFSWLRADNTTRQKNFVIGDAMKVLIPKEFGGGYIKGHYDGYGRLIVKEDEEEYSLNELTAFWNEYAIGNKDVRHCFNMDAKLQYDGIKPTCPKVSKYTDNNLSIGIDIACYDDQIVKLKYPLKLVSVRYKGSYEDCHGISLTDPNQGFCRLYD